MPVRMIIVSGMSGSGRTTAIHALEDCGYFCVDNLPIVLLDKFLTLAERHEEIKRVALGIDTRERGFLHAFEEAINQSRALGHEVEVLFLDARDDVLIRRFSETRRRHPLAEESGSLADGIAKERQMLRELRALANRVIDTSEMNVHELKALIQRLYDERASGRMAVVVMSFGYRHGLPRESHYTFDCRFLPNPYFVEGLRAKSGLDREVRDFLLSQPLWHEYMDRLRSFLSFALPMHEREGKALTTIAFGCTGGRHRSVAVAEEVGRWLTEEGWSVRVVHRDVEEQE